MILEWDGIEFQLISPVDAAGTAPGLPPLIFNNLMTWNSVDLGYYNLDRTKCQAGAARRITRNNLAQADGEITHRKFKSGYVIELNAQLWEKTGSGGIPACAGVLRAMGDVLGEYLEALANNDGQLIWFPSSWNGDLSAIKPRMLDQARSMGPSGNDSSGSSFVSVVVEEDPENGLTDVTFALLSPLPYLTDFMDYPTTPDATVTFAVGVNGGTTITNMGNSAYHPIIRVYGPTDGGFAVVNFSTLDEVGNDLAITYDATLPGAFDVPGGSYVEIDTFTSTAILFNPGGGTDNAKACIDPLFTDYWLLEPGANNIGMEWVGTPGTEVQIDYRNAWI